MNDESEIVFINGKTDWTTIEGIDHVPFGNPTKPDITTDTIMMRTEWPSLIRSRAHQCAPLRAAKPIQKGEQPAMKGNSLCRDEVLPNRILRCRSQPARLKLFFARSIPIVVTFIWTSPIFKWLCRNPLWRIAMPLR